MSDYDHVDAHRLEVSGRIDERLTFRDARTRRRHVDRVRGQSLFRELKGDARPGRVLEEKVHYRRAS